MITIFTCPRCGIQIRREWDLNSNPCPVAFELCCVCCMSTGRQMRECIKTWKQEQGMRGLIYNLNKRRKRSYKGV